MRPVFVVRAAIACALLAATSACRDSTGPASDQALDEALKQLDATGTLAAPGVVMLGGIVPPAASASAGCAYNSATQRFECPTVTHEGMSASRYYQLLDGAGAVQGQWGPTVVAIRNVMDIGGTLAAPGGSGSSITLTAHEEQTLSGLRSAVQARTGTGTSTTSITLPLGRYTAHSTQTTNLTLPDRDSGGLYPTGTITMAMTVDGGLSANMTMTYDGTSRVRMVMTHGSGPAITCTYDLATPSVPPGCG